MSAQTSTPTALTEPLARGILVRRYKRFLADVKLDTGKSLTVHCANSGSMLGMNTPGMPVVISDSQNPARKLRHTLELVQVDDGPGKTWVGVHTGRPNRMVEDAIGRGVVPGLRANMPLRREVPYGENSRVDLLAQPPGEQAVYVEVKNTTLAQPAADGALEARFPDAVTARGLKHARALTQRVEAGDRAMMVFLVNRGDCVRFSPAADIDPAYARGLADAAAAGVEVVALQARHHVRTTSTGVRASRRFTACLPIDLGA